MKMKIPMMSKVLLSGEAILKWGVPKTKLCGLVVNLSLRAGFIEFAIDSQQSTVQNSEDDITRFCFPP